MDGKQHTRCDFQVAGNLICLTVSLLMLTSLVETQLQSNICPMTCINRTCADPYGNPPRLDCTYGCLYGYMGTKCDHLPFIFMYVRGRRCQTGVYGSHCSLDCPSQCLHDICAKATGICTYRCKGNLTGNHCTHCKVGNNGVNCSLDCSEQCLHSKCEQNSGTCSNGCVDGYSGDKCCLNNHYCAKCADSDVCEICVSGMHGVRCDARCVDTCNERGCAKGDGSCRECKLGYYGEFCEKSCPLRCRYSETLNCGRYTGYCYRGCVTGFYGDFCNKTCSGNCDNNACSQDGSACLQGCVSGYQGASCSEVDESGTNHLLIVGIVSAIIGIAILFLFALIIRRYRRSGQDNEQSVPERETEGPVNVYDSINLDDNKSSCVTLKPQEIQPQKDDNAPYAYENGFV